MSVDEPLGIGLIGCGTVGAGVARLLLEQPRRLASRAGRSLILRTIVVRDPSKPRPDFIPRDLFTTELRRLLDDRRIDVAVELVGGTDWARRASLDCLTAGKHLVTANKALLAIHGTEVFEAAHRHGRTVAFEASVAGGIPILGAIAQGLAANQILALQGILNGTCNFILTGMSEGGLSYAAALEEAQRRGYAEADPTLDVSGLDTAHKLAILARVAFGVAVPVDAIDRRGIADVDPMDVRFAGELGYTVKLLAEAWLDNPAEAPVGTPPQLALHVSPVLLRRSSPLAQVRGSYNAVRVVADPVGETLYYGKGAGQMPTASAVTADLVDLAVGRAQQTFQTLRLWAAAAAAVLRPAATVRSRYYLRLLVPDRPGVLAEVARVLADHGISIASVIQHEAQEDHEGDLVPLVIMTHAAPTGDFRAALAAIRAQGRIVAGAAYFPVAD